MRITIAPPAGGGSWGSEVELTAGLYASPENLIYNGTSVVDMVQVLESAAQVPIDRGNQASNITFRFTHENASFKSSEEDLISYFASIPRYGKVQFYAEGNLSSAFAYMIGAITNFADHEIGVTTMRDFTIVGTPITTIPHYVMKADASVADAYSVIDWGSDQSEVWVTYDQRFTTAALTFWGVDGSGELSTILDSSNSRSCATQEYTDSSVVKWLLFGGGSNDLTAGPPPPVPDVWQTCELHVTVTSNTVAELYVNTVLTATFTDAETLIPRKLSVGQRNTITNGTDDITYVRNVKIGTTRGASDLFADDFSSGTLSLWTVTGTCTVIPDPF